MSNLAHRRKPRVRFLALTVVGALAASATFALDSSVSPPVGAAATAGTIVGTTSYIVPAGAIVVAPSGSDSAAGSATAPVRSLARAVAIAPTGGTVVMRAGTYHESVVIPSTKQLTVQSWPNEAVWLDGTVRVSGWTPSGSQWRHDGWTLELDASPTYTRGAADNTQQYWGFVDPAYPMAAHPDQVWIDNVRQRQVGSRAEVTVGTFYVDKAADQLWLGTDPTGREVRASTLTRALMVRSAGSIVRGLGIRRYAPSVPDMAAMTVENLNVRVEDVAIWDSATTGLHVGSGITTSGVVVQNVHIARSGMLGMSATYADNLVVDRLLSEANNAERFNMSPVSGGIKIGRTRLAVVRDGVFRDNHGPGIWFDESSYNIKALRNQVTGNGKHGIAFEISAKAIARDNVVVNNVGFGLKVNNTSSVTVAGNTFSGNDRSINLVQDSRQPTSASTPGRDKRQPFPDPTMSWKLGPVAVSTNKVAHQSAGSCMLCVEDYTFTRTAEQIGVTADADTFYRLNSTTPRYLVVWSKGPGNPAAFTSIGAFRNATGQEATGTELLGSGGPSLSSSTTSSTTVAPAPSTTTTTLAGGSAVAADTFERSVTAGLGNADTGGAWTTSGSPTNYAVALGLGFVTGSVGAHRAAYLEDVSIRDLDLRVDVALQTPPSGGGAYVSVVGRRTASRSDFRVKLRYLTDGSVVAYLVRTIDGAEVVLDAATLPNTLVALGEPLSVRLSLSGSATTTARAKVWRAATSEPTDWWLTDSRSTPAELQGPGSLGVSVYTSGSWVGTTPTVTTDGLQVTPI